MLTEPSPWTLKAFSKPRLAPYMTAARGDATAAMWLYWWNIEASAAFYGPLHCLEVSLRNAFHNQLRAMYGCPDWWWSAPLDSSASGLVRKAYRKAAERRAHLTPDDVVVELTFGFWVSLISARHHRTLWVPALYKAFPHYSGLRRVLHDNLLTMVLLRNRIMHHEPIHHRDLAADHAKVYRLLGYITPELVAEARRLDRVADVLARRADVCGGRHAPRF